MAGIKRDQIKIPRGILSNPSGSISSITIGKNGSIRVKIRNSNNRRT